MIKRTISRTCVIAGLMVGTIAAQAVSHDAKINIDRALNSPTLAVRYSGAHAALVELRVNGESFGTRLVTSGKDSGETTFNLDLGDLKDGENDIEVRLFDRAGKLVGSEHSNISTEQSLFAPVSLLSPKVGQTLMGPVKIKLGFGQQLKNVYVSFFVDNNFKAMTNYPPFEYTWDSAKESNGWHELEAWAIDDTSTTYKTRKVKVFVDNPGGHTYRPGYSESATTPSVNPRTVDIIDTGAGIRSMNKPGRIVAAASSKTLAPVLRNGVVQRNALRVQVVDTIESERPLPIPHGVSTGVRNLYPTGRRVAATVHTKSAPASTVRSTAVPAATARAAQMPAAAVKPQLKSNDAQANSFQTLFAHEPHSSHDLFGLNQSSISTSQQPSEIQIAATPRKIGKSLNPASVVVAKHSQRARIPKSATLSAVHNVTRFLPITLGQHIPNIGSFAILMNSEYVHFDVPTRVDRGVPMAPFRHLIEKAGGSIDWTNKTKTLDAHASGNSIFIQIGDKVAKINDSRVIMELAPYIDRGRTIVPVSLLREALNVDVQYDAATGHVLITKIKKPSN